MVKIRAFAGYRPAEAQVQNVACPPYDVVTEAEAREFVETAPLSFMHVLRPEVNLPEGSTGEQQHAEAAKQFAQMVDQGLLIRDLEPCLYLYRLSDDEHVQVGLVAACSVDEYENDIVKKHEHVRPLKVNDRAEHFETVGAQTGPIFVAYKDDERIQALFASELNAPPLYSFLDEKQVRHEVFQVQQISELEAAFENVDALYIADGHHRTASACAVRERRGQVDESDPSNQFLAVIFPESQLNILAYNRIVKDLEGMAVSEFIESVSRLVPVTETSQVPPQEKGIVCFYVDGRWHQMDLRPLLPSESELEKTPELGLDANLLQHHIFGPILGIDDPRTNPRIDFWGGHKTTTDLANAVDSGAAAVAFSMYPVSMSDIIQVSDADRIMPPKSTWFEPKLRSGLFIYDLK